jgi:hypothetical protein
VVLPGDDLVADPDDQLVGIWAEAPTRAIRVGRGFLEDRVRDDHLPWNEIRADAEVLEGSLRLSAPELIGGNRYFSKTICLNASFGHYSFLL